MTGIPPLSEPALALLIDDSPLERFMAREALEQAGFDVLEADNGAAGMALFAKTQPDIVLLDVKMPGMDGFEVCQAIRRRADGAHTLILMLTGLEDVESINRAYEVGATDFFNKPMHTAILQHRVRYLLRAKLTADELRRSEAKLARAQRMAKLGLWEWRLDLDTVQWSDDVESMLGASLRTNAGVSGALAGYMDEATLAHLEQALASVCATGTPVGFEHTLTAADGSKRIVHHAIDRGADGDGKETRLVGTVLDISAHREAEQHIRQLAYFDPVTSLPNRAFLTELLSRTIALARRHDHAAAVLFLDLDQFKRVNDSFGHSVGDDVLREVARRLRDCVRECDALVHYASASASADMDIDIDIEQTVARLGGDEFVILLPQVRDVSDASRVARRIRATLDKPIKLEGRALHMTVSMGISCFPMDGDDVEALLKHADAAMYQAKAKGRNRYQFFTESMDQHVQKQMSLELDLRAAFIDRAFTLHYQPIIDVATGTVCAAEALLRWNSHTGMVPPAAFIPIAEETGLIVPLGQWALREACLQAQEWARRGTFSGRISVNLSAVQLAHPDLVTDIKSALEQTGLPPTRLQLELTESMVMQNTEHSASLLGSLKALGVTIAIDDFGTGYSSLAYLKRFPIDVLKIDRSFVRDLSENSDDAAIVSATLILARALRLEVVAEGVETTAQHKFLHDHGCDECQGFLFSKPLPANEFAPWLETFANSSTGLELAAPEVRYSSVLP